MLFAKTKYLVLFIFISFGIAVFISAYSRKFLFVFFLIQETRINLLKTHILKASILCSIFSVDVHVSAAHSNAGSILHLTSFNFSFCDFCLARSMLSLSECYLCHTDSILFLHVTCVIFSRVLLFAEFSLYCYRPRYYINPLTHKMAVCLHISSRVI